MRGALNTASTSQSIFLEAFRLNDRGEGAPKGFSGSISGAPHWPGVIVQTAVITVTAAGEPPSYWQRVQGVQAPFSDTHDLLFADQLSTSENGLSFTRPVEHLSQPSDQWTNSHSHTSHEPLIGPSTTAFFFK